MNTTAPTTPVPATALPSASKTDNRSAYISFAAAFILGTAPPHSPRAPTRCFPCPPGPPPPCSAPAS